MALGCNLLPRLSAQPEYIPRACNPASGSALCCYECYSTNLEKQGKDDASFGPLIARSALTKRATSPKEMSAEGEVSDFFSLLLGIILPF